MNSPEQPSRDRQIRVFISSMFRDMQAERDHLVKFIFPQLRKLCESRGVTSTQQLVFQSAPRSHDRGDSGAANQQHRKALMADCSFGLVLRKLFNLIFQVPYPTSQDL
jgi:hypothetical protein